MQSEHDLRIGKVKALAEYRQEAADRAFENATKEVDDRRQEFFVRRGSARHYAPAASATLKPGEHVFVKRPNGRFESIGVVNSAGELPPPEIIT